jgi:hypothetical protein
MLQMDGAYRHLILAVTDFSREELHSLAGAPGPRPAPSEALIDDLCRTLAGHTQIGRSLRLTSVVRGPIPLDPDATRIDDTLLSWIRYNCAA